MKCVSFSCKDTPFCSFVLIAKAVKRHKLYILIKLCSLFWQEPEGESSVWEMNEMESRSERLHKQNQMLQGSRSSREEFQHAPKKQTVL